MICPSCRFVNRKIKKYNRFFFFTEKPRRSSSNPAAPGLILTYSDLFSDTKDTLGIFHPLFCGRLDAFQSVGDAQSLPFENPKSMIRKNLYPLHIL